MVDASIPHGLILTKHLSLREKDSRGKRKSLMVLLSSLSLAKMATRCSHQSIIPFIFIFQWIALAEGPSTYK